MRKESRNKSDAGTTITTFSSRGRSDKSTGDMQELSPPPSCEDAELKVGEAVAATPEGLAAIRDIRQDYEKNPEKYANYAWEDN